MNAANSTTIYVKTCKILNDREELIIKFPSEKNVREHVIMLVLCIILLFSTVFLNGTALTAIWKSHLLKAKVSSYPVMLRSVMDLAIGVVIIPLFITLLAGEINGNPRCDVYFTSKKLGVLFYIYSVTTMAAMNLERYMSVLHPVTHRNKVTKTKFLLYTILACVIQTILFALSILFARIFPFIVATITLLLVTTTVFVYARIFHKANSLVRRHVVQVSGQSQSAANSRKRKFSKELKLAISYLLVVVCCLACFLPSTISYIDRLRIQPGVSLVVRRRWFALLIVLSTTVNPVIFFGTNKALRESAINSLKRFYSR